MHFLTSDPYRKQIKNASGLSDEDRKKSRSWLKFYANVKKKVPEVTTHYHAVRNDAGKLLADARELDLILIESMQNSDEELTAEDQKRVTDLFKDMKNIRPRLNCNFLIGYEDKAIHDTVEGLVGLQTNMLEGKIDFLILQSEAENLIAMICECMEREKPDLFELSSFYVQHTEKELEELPHRKQLEKIHDLYRKEFADPIRPVLISMMKKQYNCDDETAGVKAEDFLKEISTI